MNMTEENFLKAVQTVIPTNAKLTLDTRYDSLGGDSLDDIELVMCIEDDYGIEITDEAAESISGMFTTLGDGYQFLSYIEKNKIFLVDMHAITEYKNLLKGNNQTSKKKPANHRKAWSVKDSNKLIFRYAQGAPISVIASEFGRTKIAVLSKLAELRLVQYDKLRNAYFTVPTLIHQC